LVYTLLRKVFEWGSDRGDDKRRRLPRTAKGRAEGRCGRGSPPSPGVSPTGNFGKFYV